MSNIDGPNDETVRDIIGAMAGSGLSYDDQNDVLSSASKAISEHEAAKSFTETDVTVTHTTAKTQVSGGSVELKDEYVASTVNKPGALSELADNQDGHGLIVNPNQSLAGVRVTVSNDAGVQTSGTVYLDDGSGTTLDSASVSPGSTVDLKASLASATKYRVYLVDGTNSAAYYGTPGFPLTSSAIDVENGWINSGSGTYNGWLTFDSVEALDAGESGSVYVEWPHPTDLYEWDVATITQTPDSETVNVYIAYNDGTGWVRTNSGNPIPRNYSLQGDSNISDTDEVRFEVGLSRANTANNPTFDSAVRSWLL